MASTSAASAAARLEAAAEAMLLVAIVVAPWPYGSAPDAARYALVAWLLLAVALWAAAVAARRSGLPRTVPALLALPAFGLVQILLGRSIAPVWTAEGVLVLTALIGVALVWSERGRDRGAAWRLAATVLAACSVQAVFAVVQSQAHPGEIYGHRNDIVTMPYGSYVDHNHFAGLVEMAVVLAAAMALGHAARRGTPTPASLALGGLSLGLAAAHLASRSRGGLVALAAGLAVLGGLWLARPRHDSAHEAPQRPAGMTAAIVAVVVVGVLGFGLAAVPATTRGHLATLLRGGGLSGEYRVDIAQATLRLAVARPFAGWGLAAYPDAVPAFKRGHGEVRTTHAESDALEVLAEGGLLGIALVVAAAAALLRGFGDRMRHGHDPFRRSLAVGALAAVAAMAVHSTVDFNLRLPANALVFTSLAGLVGAPRSELPRFGAGRAAGALAIVVAVAAAAAAWRAVGAVALEDALSRPERPLRIAGLDAVLRAHPYLAEAYRARGDARAELAVASAATAPPRLARAEEDLGRALALRPAWGEAWAELARVRWLRRDAEGARTAAATARRLDPTHPGIARLCASILGEAGLPVAGQ
jgi:O-antigen ligase